MEKIPYFDAHCDTLSRCLHSGESLFENSGHLDLKRLLSYGKTAQVFAIFCDAAKAPPDGMFAECRRQQEFFAEEMERNSAVAVHCRNSAEIENAVNDGKVAALLSCEGAELLNCDPELLPWAREVGIRAVNLTWNHPNLLSGTHMRDTERGLSDRAHVFVREAQKCGILIDVSHLSDRGFWDLEKITQAPIIASHSDSRAVCGSTRNLTDDMFRVIRDSGGFVGINLYTEFVSGSVDASMGDVVRHIEHFLHMDGEKTLGFGLDLDGCETLAAGLHGVEDVGCLWDALRQRGYGEALLYDLFFGNLLRVMQ